MNRRDALKNTGLFVGLGLAGGAISSTLFQSCKEAQNMASGVWKAKFIPTDLVDMVAEITETILPRTDTPGAKDVKVHQFLDSAWNLLYQPEERAHIMKGLLAFDNTCKQEMSKSFIDLTVEERLSHLTAVEVAAKREAEAMILKKPFVPVRQGPMEEPIVLQPFWNYLKRDTIHGFLLQKRLEKMYLLISLFQVR